MEAGLVGAVKVKDGLFIGDEFAAQVRTTQDLEFVVANKVTHVINCASRQVPNHWEPIGVRYLSYPWLDQDTQVQLDPRDEVFRDIFAFVEKASNNGESVLIHGVRDLAKSVVLVTAYLMRKFRWAMFKTLEFVNSRAPNVHLVPNFIHQLASFESRLTKAGVGPKTTDWTVGRNFEDSEEMMLHFTFLNAQQVPMLPGNEVGGAKRGGKLLWKDKGTGEVGKLTGPHPAASNTVEDGFVLLKSALKGGTQDRTRVPLRSTQSRRIGKQKLDYLTDNVRYAKAAESAIEYGSLQPEDRPSLRGRTQELLSPTRPELPTHPELPRDSLLVGKKTRAASADHKEIEQKPMLPVKRPLKLPVSDDFVSVTELKIRESPAAVSRPGPVKPPTNVMSRSTGALNKVKRPVTAPSKRPPSPTQYFKSGEPRTKALGQSKTTSKLPLRAQPWHLTLSFYAGSQPVIDLAIKMSLWNRTKGNFALLFAAMKRRSAVLKTRENLALLFNPRNFAETEAFRLKAVKPKSPSRS